MLYQRLFDMLDAANTLEGVHGEPRLTLRGRRLYTYLLKRLRRHRARSR